MRVCLVMLALLVGVSEVSGQNVRINVDFAGVSSAQDEQEVIHTSRLFDETRTGVVGYPELPVVKGVKVGVTFGRTFGVGVNLDFLNYEQTTGLGINVPHPTRFNRFGTDVAVSQPLERKDRNVDIRAVYIAPTPPQWSIQLFGGPTYLHLTEERISGILYDQMYTLGGVNNITITSAPKESVTGSAWGFNVGADVGFFFTDHVGVGAQVSANQGTVTLEDPFTADDVERKAGHVTFGGGLRLRF